MVLRTVQAGGRGKTKLGLWVPGGASGSRARGQGRKLRFAWGIEKASA